MFVIFVTFRSVAAPVNGGVFSDGTGKIMYDELNCDGTEQSIDDCQAAAINDCFHDEDAAVICNPGKMQCSVCLCICILAWLVRISGGSRGPRRECPP